MDWKDYGYAKLMVSSPVKCSFDFPQFIAPQLIIFDNCDRGENLKEIIYCHVDINMVEVNERMSKWTHLFKLSQPFSRYRSSKLRFMMRNSDKIRLFSRQIPR